MFQSVPQTLLFSALIAFMLYRRVRSHIGRQAFSPRRAWVRMVLLSIICLLFLGRHVSDPVWAAAAAAGATLGIGLGLYALRHTQFEITASGSFYTPNLYIGLGVTALLLGRIAFRVLALQGLREGGGAPMGAMQSPGTLGVYFILAGYYVSYYAGLLKRNRPEPVTPESPAPSAGA